MGAGEEVGDQVEEELQIDYIGQQTPPQWHRALARILRLRVPKLLDEAEREGYQVCLDHVRMIVATEMRRR